jgi:hypothetical protein
VATVEVVDRGRRIAFTFADVLDATARTRRAGRCTSAAARARSAGEVYDVAS